MEYDELHSLSYDISHSACGECEFVADCQYYYGKCPNMGEWMMALKFRSHNNDLLMVLIYGEDKTGKSTLAEKYCKNKV